MPRIDLKVKEKIKECSNREVGVSGPTGWHSPSGWFMLVIQPFLGSKSTMIKLLKPIGNDLLVSNTFLAHQGALFLFVLSFYLCMCPLSMYLLTF